jgi:hypothetical protein
MSNFILIVKALILHIGFNINWLYLLFEQVFHSNFAFDMFYIRYFKLNRYFKKHKYKNAKVKKWYATSWYV